jgi:mono/diheme cytochrome c family protein
MPVLAGLFALGPAAMAADEILQSQCASCHALEPPASPDIERLWQRQGPDLYYAGSKFNRPWLEQWLQDPQRIRPGGVLYTRYVRGSDKEDIIDDAALKPHPKLSTAAATAAAEALMALKAPPELIEPGIFKGGKVSASMGAMFFNKLRGCSACHQSAPDVGGRSGPELYTAGARLQPDYIYSYMRHPQKIDPLVWMPDLNLSEPDAQRLTGYVLLLDKARSQP